MKPTLFVTIHPNAPDLQKAVEVALVTAPDKRSEIFLPWQRSAATWNFERALHTAHWLGAELVFVVKEPAPGPLPE